MFLLDFPVLDSVLPALDVALPVLCPILTISNTTFLFGARRFASLPDFSKKNFYLIAEGFLCCRGAPVLHALTFPEKVSIFSRIVILDFQTLRNAALFTRNRTAETHDPPAAPTRVVSSNQVSAV